MTIYMPKSSLKKSPGQTYGKVLLCLTLLGTLSLLPVHFAAAESQIEIESDGVSADSEADLADAEEAKVRAEIEQNQAREAKKAALKEAAEAKKVKSQARAEIKTYNAEQKKALKERLTAEAKTAAAQAEIKKAQQEAELVKLALEKTRAETDKAVAERDAAEKQSEVAQDNVTKLNEDLKKSKEHQVQVRADVAAAKRKMMASAAQLQQTKNWNGKEVADLRMALLEDRKQLRAIDKKIVELDKKLDSVHSDKMKVAALSSTGDGNRNEGWVKVHKECAIRKASSDSANIISEHHQPGEKFYAHKVDNQWMQVKMTNGAEGFMNISCFKNE